MRTLLFILFASLLFSGCKSVSTTSGSTSGAGKYAEDLSVWRPEVEEAPTDTAAEVKPAPERIRTNLYIEPRLSVTRQVDAVLDSIHNQNLQNGHIDGYTIQVYSGISREDALNMKKKLSQSLPDLESDVQYRQPNFRVRTGKYFTRLEAQKDYLAVKRVFPNAIVIPDRIPLQ